ncbi:MAG TPA: phosphopyruvate hydratase, partial [Nakamurella sp.]
AVLGTSLAIGRASAVATGQPLYRRIAQLAGDVEPILPMPMVNILSGGLHAGRGMDVQDFLAVPVSATSTLEAIALTSRVRAAATRLCAERGLPTLLADEGGLSPACRTGQEALELLTRSIETAGLTPGTDICIAIDVAANSLYDRATGDYHLRRQERHLSTADMIDMVSTWVDSFPIVSIEDPLDEEDWDGWQTLTARIGHRVRLIGDDLFTTNSARLAEGITRGAANGVLIKVNQNGTLTGTLDVVAQARAAGYAPVVSARSGETEDDFLADLAVGTGAGQIKIGSVRNSERLAKYNQLVRIAEDPTLGFSMLPAPAAPALALR